MTPGLFRRAVCIALALPAAASANEPVSASEPVVYLGEPDCRIEQIYPRPTKGLKWSGACKDGYAEGNGILTWSSQKEDLRLEVTLEQGQIRGEGTLTAKQYTYIGTLRHGQPQGQGYFRFKNGFQYEGDVANCNPEGYGVGIFPDGSRYEGQWKSSKRHGSGNSTFGLGGSYKGEWKDDRFDGQGAVVYAGHGHKYEGLFADGRPVGAAHREIAARGKFKFKKRGDSPLPVSSRWEELTEAQQNFQKKHYPALEEGDEPPYPENGSKELFNALLVIQERLRTSPGMLRLHVLVGADGLATTVSALSSPDPELTRLASMALLVQRYKPALCRGQPCEMIYPINFEFL